MNNELGEFYVSGDVALFEIAYIQMYRRKTSLVIFQENRFTDKFNESVQKQLQFTIVASLYKSARKFPVFLLYYSEHPLFLTPPPQSHFYSREKIFFFFLIKKEIFLIVLFFNLLIFFVEFYERETLYLIYCYYVKLRIFFLLLNI